MEQPCPLHTIPDQELLDRLAQLILASRRTEADLVAHVAEVDERRLYTRKACSSMFAYCIEVLHLSEPEAYLRIIAARASRKHPALLTLLAEGKLHLSGIALLAPHLTPENRDIVLARASHRSKREIEQLVAELSPRPDAPALMRKLPQRRNEVLEGGSAEGAQHRLDAGATTGQLRPDGVAVTPTPAPPPSRAIVEPLAPARYKVTFTAGAGLHEKLERLRALMRPQVPDGDLAALIEQAVTEKLERLEARRFGRTGKPRKTLMDTDTSASSRHIPAAVKRFVAQRDGMRCRYVDEQGRRCSERHRLEFHHRHPFGFGGDHRPDAICLMCPSHNRLLAEHDYGADAMARHRAAGRGSGHPIPLNAG
jgi:hypothetical protein